MKLLLKSQDLTASIIVSVRFRRNYWAMELRRYTDMKDISENDRNIIVSDATQIINECNSVLDAIGIED